MRAIVLLTLCLCLRVSAQTNIICFTNSSGLFITNATAVKIAANKLMYTYADGGGVVKLADLPPDIQKQFNYDPTNAAIQDQQEVADKMDADMKAKIDEENKWVEKTEKESRSKLFAERVDANVKVLQTTTQGILVIDSKETIALIADHHPKVGETTFDGDSIHILAYPMGEFEYTTVGGVTKKVRKLTENLNWAVSYDIYGIP